MMNRTLLSAAAIALLSAAVGAQAPKALSPQQKGELYKKNQSMIEKIVGQTVEAAKTPNFPLKRAKTYYDLVVSLNSGIRAARAANDTDRVKELTDHLNTLLDKGLTPTLLNAKVQDDGGSGAEEYEKVKVDLLAQLNALIDVLDDQSAAKQTISGAKARLEEITGPTKK
jgi:hypothetical protein